MAKYTLAATTTEAGYTEVSDDDPLPVSFVGDLTVSDVDAMIADGADVTQGAIGDDIVAAGAVGTVSAKLRRITQALEDLKTTIVAIVTGNVAHDAVDSGNPLKVGGVAQNPDALPTAVAAADRTNLYSDLSGRLIVYLGTKLDSTNDSVSIPAATTSIGKAEDAASADADVGVPAMAVQKATPADLADTDGDYAMLQMSAGRLWCSSLIPAAATSIGKAEDAASANADVGVPAMAVQKATPANTAGADGDYEFLQVSAGRLWVSGIVTAEATSIGKAEDVASANADVGVPAMAVQKATPANTAGTDGDYEMLQISAGRLWVSGLVTAAAASIGKAEDVASADADVGVPAMAVQKATPANTAGTDGDYEMLQMSAGRLWCSALVTAAAASIGKAEDAASADADVGVGCLAVRKATPANTSGADGDYEFLQISAGRLWVSSTVTDVVPGVAATNLGKAEDAAHASGDTGVQVLCVRNDALAATFTSTDGDYSPLAVNANGALFLEAGKAEDAASANADRGIPAMVVQKATPANSAGTDGDYEFLQASGGRLWVSAVDQTDVIRNGATELTPKFAFANVAASTTDGSVVAAVASKKIRVLALKAQAGATATNITFNSKPGGAGTAKTSTHQNAANGGFVLPYNPLGWFETASGEGLSATTGAGSTTGVDVVYVEV